MTMATKISGLVGIAIVLLVAGVKETRAERPISIVVGYAPGGTTDTIARIIGARLSEKLGRPVIIENKAGATGQLGSRYVAKAEPDGSTIQIATQTTHAVAPSLYGHIGYDPIKDFTPIILAAWSPLVLVTNPALKVTSVKELIEYVKARPGEVNYATGGRGDGSHLAALFFNKLAGITPVAVPFQGEGPALPAVLGNQVPYMFLSAPTAVGCGRIRTTAGTGGHQQGACLDPAAASDTAGIRAARLRDGELVGIFRSRRNDAGERGNVEQGHRGSSQGTRDPPKIDGPGIRNNGFDSPGVRDLCRAREREMVRGHQESGLDAELADYR